MSMLPIIQILGRPIQTSLLVLLLAFSVCISVLERSAALAHLSRKDISNLAYGSVVVGLLAARLGYVIQYWTIYRDDLVSIVALNLNGLSPIFGFVAVLTSGFLYAHRRKIPLRDFLDVLTPGALVLAGGLALGDLVSGNGYGLPTQLPWGIRQWGELRHPTQLYDLLAVVVIGILLWRLKSPFAGAKFGVFLTFYAVSRLILEIFHADSQEILGFRSVQVWSFFALILGVSLLHRWASDCRHPIPFATSDLAADTSRSNDVT